MDKKKKAPRQAKPPLVNLDSLNGAAANLRAVAGDDMMHAAMEIVRERLRLTPEKLAILLIRTINPDEIIGQGEEAMLRNVKADTLKEAKDRGEFAREISGLQIPVKSQNGGFPGTERR